MSYTLTAELKPQYLHVTVQGKNSSENVLSYLTEMQRKCAELDVSHVLLEENLQGPSLGTVDVFEIIKEVSVRAFPYGIRLAYVDTNPEHDMKMMQFAEHVASNRGISVKIFCNIGDAEKWLTTPQGSPGRISNL